MPSPPSRAVGAFVVVFLVWMAACGDGQNSARDSESTLSDTDGFGPDGSLSDATSNQPSDAGQLGEDASAADGASNPREDVDVEYNPPTAADDLETVTEDTDAVVDLLANDRPIRDDLTIEVIDAPAHGEVNIAQDATATYHSSPDYNGDDTFRYRVSDPDGRADEATVEVTVYEELADAPGAPQVHLPRTGIQPDELAVVVNDNDADSQTIADYYVQQRHIPDANVVHVELPADGAVVDPQTFNPVLAELEQSLGAHIQAYALAWMTPYRVGCMGITSAFALGGYDDSYCNTSSQTCTPTDAVGYFDSESTRPFEDHQIRPAMMLAGTSTDNVFALIDRGVAADNTFPEGTGYLVRTTDSARSNPRWSDFQSMPDLWDGVIDFNYIDNADGSASNVVTDAPDVLFYLTGLTRVDDLATNTYLPGAVADHLTSFGGRLDGGGQMSIVRWLEGGATASYGTAVEPCSYAQKFPAASTLIDHYFRGNTLLEAYWKSVSWPGEGVFVGEPLAHPWARPHLRWDGQTLTIRTTMLAQNTPYQLIGSADADLTNPQTVVDEITVEHPQDYEISVDDPQPAFLELRPAP